MWTFEVACIIKHSTSNGCLATIIGETQVTPDMVLVKHRRGSYQK